MNEMFSVLTFFAAVVGYLYCGWLIGGWSHDLIQWVKGKRK